MLFCVGVNTVFSLGFWPPEFDEVWCISLITPSYSLSLRSSDHSGKFPFCCETFICVYTVEMKTKDFVKIFVNQEKRRKKDCFDIWIPDSNKVFGFSNFQLKSMQMKTFKCFVLFFSLHSCCLLRRPSEFFYSPMEQMNKCQCLLHHKFSLFLQVENTGPHLSSARPNQRSAIQVQESTRARAHVWLIKRSYLGDHTIWIYLGFWQMRPL